MKSSSGLCFYDWETQEMIRRIDIQPKNVFWSENGEMCCITTDDSYFILKYIQENVAAALENKDEMVDEDGIEEAFDVLGEIEEIVKTGVWVGDCFIYTNSGKSPYHVQDIFENYHADSSFHCSICYLGVITCLLCFSYSEQAQLLRRWRNRYSFTS